MKPLSENKPIIIGGVVAMAMLAAWQSTRTPSKPTVTPKAIVARDLGVEVIALEVDANGFVLGAGIVVPPEWTPTDAQKHCQSVNQYVLWKVTDGTQKPDRGWQLIDGAWMPPKPYPTWTQDKQKQQWTADVAKPADASTKPYYYVLPDVQKGETKGNWTADPAKMSPPETGPPLPPQSFPTAQKVTGRWYSLRECSLTDSTWNQIYCTVSAEWVCVAGGGGASIGAGGAGGLLDGTGANALTITSGTGYTVTIGAGGNGGSSTSSAASDGSNSVFNTGTAVGGGGGAGENQTGRNGGSGGAAGDNDPPTKNGGTATQGNSGGATGYGSNGGANYGAQNHYPAPGGGGANAVGAGPDNPNIANVAGNGGAGKQFFGASNANTTYAGGGGGGVGYGSGTAGTGGSGGGGAGSASGAGTAGTANTGGGGGGSANGNTGGAGGSGIVMIRCLLSDSVSATGGTHTSDATYDVWRFTASGTWTPTFGGAVRQPRPPGGLNHIDYNEFADLWDRKRAA